MNEVNLTAVRSESEVLRRIAVARDSIGPVGTHWRLSLIRQLVTVDIFVARMSNVILTFSRVCRIRLCCQCVPVL